MDAVRETFLMNGFEEAMALASESDLLTLYPVAGTPPDRYVAEFNCTGLVEAAPGQIVKANHFAIGIWFPDDYLRRANPFQVLTWLTPRNPWHPNICPPAASPFEPMGICPGHLVSGTTLVDILYQCFEIITWNKVTMVESNCLNKPACVWARSNLDRFPVDTRPLKRSVVFELEEVR